MLVRLATIDTPPAHERCTAGPLLVTPPPRRRDRRPGSGPRPSVNTTHIMDYVRHLYFIRQRSALMATPPGWRPCENRDDLKSNALVPFHELQRQQNVPPKLISSAQVQIRRTKALRIDKRPRHPQKPARLLRRAPSLKLRSLGTLRRPRRPTGTHQDPTTTRRGIEKSCRTGESARGAPNTNSGVHKPRGWVGAAAVAMHGIPRWCAVIRGCGDTSIIQVKKLVDK